MYNAQVGVYLISNKANGKNYVGKSIHLDERQKVHRRKLNRDEHQNPHLASAWVCYGSGAFTTDTLLNCAEEDLLFWEDWCMWFFDSMNSDKGYNLQSADQQTISNETRKRISAARKGRPFSPLSVEHKAAISAALKGKPHTPEHNAKVSQAKKGVAMSMEQKAKLSVSHKGRRCTPEARANMSAARMGHVVSPETRAKISAAQKGKPKPRRGSALSIEHKSNLSTARQGKPWSQARREAQDKRKESDAARNV